MLPTPVVQALPSAGTRKQSKAWPIEGTPWDLTLQSDQRKGGNKSGGSAVEYEIYFYF